MSYIVGVDIGGTKCAVCLGSSEGEVFDRREMETDPGEEPERVLGKLCEHAKSILRDRNVQMQTLKGVGVSCGGPLDSSTGMILSPPNLPLWIEVPAGDILRREFPNIHVVLENDANATALAEWKFGAGRGCVNMLYLTMGTGIGCGMILDGRLYHGTNDLAGEAGHQTILLNGPICKCGKKGCLEALSSGPAIARLAQDSLHYGRGKQLVEKAGGKPANITAKHVVECAKEGDAFSIRILEEAGFYMGVGLSNLIQILNPQKIVLGTIAVHAGDLILNPIRETLKEYTWARSLSVCEVVPAELGDRAQDLAAIALI
jgi:glucokinase